jgi:glycosyltransferase involved in cell wall biosynthesis
VKIGIYNEPSEGGMGGSELSVAVLAGALGHFYDVEIIHHRSALRVEQLAEFADADLRAVRLRYVQAESFNPGTGYNPWKRLQEAQRWQANLSKPYDIFINFTHHYPPYCHARRGILNVLFPLHNRPFTEFQAAAIERGDRLRWQKLKRLYYDRDWKNRLDSYQIKLSISEFTRAWTTRRWGIDSQIVYPPVDTDCGIPDKANLILSAGRFATTGHSKRQREMVEAFAQMHRTGLQDWEYLCVGGLSDLPADRTYFESVRKEAVGCPAKVLANVERARLLAFRQRAKIFWHASGYGVDDQHPEFMEHFGIATVEAMAAGCVPVVVNGGGQSEIVTHGVNGFLWNTLDELKHYTVRVMRDERLRAQMSEAARCRALCFSRESFIASFRKQIERSTSQV